MNITPAAINPQNDSKPVLKHTTCDYISNQCLISKCIYYFKEETNAFRYN